MTKLVTSGSVGGMASNGCLYPETSSYLLGSSQPTRILNEYLVHFHAERNHQGKGNVLLFPTAATQAKNRVDGSVACKERLGGLLKYYHREAA